jgi:hypothetical protein
MRGQIKVKVEINGFVYRTSLFPAAEGVHILLVNKRMQRASRGGLGVHGKSSDTVSCGRSPIG